MHTPTTRWETHHTQESWEEYKERFARLFSTGADVNGEARFLDALAERDSAILDAGCGTGRVADALRRMGHRAAGVDKDSGLVEVAQSRYPQTTYLVADLYDVDGAQLAAAGAPRGYDIVALPGNVMVYLAPGSERDVLANLMRLLTDQGRIVAGFAANRDYTPDDLVADAEALGLIVEHRFATWQLAPYRPGESDWIVAVLRAPTRFAERGAAGAVGPVEA